MMELHRALGSTYALAKKFELAFHKFPICGEKKDMSPAALQEKSGKLLEEMMILCATEKKSLTDNIRYVRQITIGPDTEPDPTPQGPETAAK